MVSLLQNKKAIGLLIFIGLGLLFASIMVILLTDVPNLEEPIGAKQYSLLYVNEQVEAAQNYLDNSLPFATVRAKDNLLESVGILSNSFSTGLSFRSPCGEHIYPLYTSPTLDCTPQFRNSYKLYTEQNFKRYLDTYKEIPLMNSITLDVISTPEHTTLVKGTTIAPHIVSVASKTTLLEQERTYPQGILGGYGNEQQIICGTGHCFAEVTSYLFDLYEKAGFRYSYIYGGESPYSFEDTLEDKNTNENSIFKNVELTEFQPGRNTKTQEGFDSSGWLWWVGYHAGLPEFQQRNELPLYYENYQDSSQLLCQKGNEQKPSCTQQFVLAQLEEGDLLFAGENNWPTEVMIYLGDNKVSRSQQGFGLIQTDIPTEYFSQSSTTFIALVRPTYLQQGKDYFLEPLSAQTGSQTSSQQQQDATRCQLPISFYEINEDAIRGSRKGMLNDLDGAVNSFNQKLLDTNQQDSVQYASASFPKIPPEYVKAIMMTEIGYSSQAFRYLSGTETGRAGSSIVGPMQISRDACDGVNRANPVEVCNHDLISEGGYEGARNGILSGTAYLNILPKASKYLNNEQPNLYFLAIAYNAGPGSLDNILEEASDRTGKPEIDLQWSDIIYDDVKNGMSRLSGSWAHESAKWTEVFEYPNLVAAALSGQCDGDVFAAYAVQSNIQFQPQLVTENDLDIERLELLEEFVTDLKTCDDNLRICVQEKVTAFNTQHQGEITITMHSEEESFAYEFVDQVLDCSKNEQTNCICDIDLPTPEQQIEGPMPQDNSWLPVVDQEPITTPENEALQTSTPNLAIQLSTDRTINIGSLDGNTFLRTQSIFSFPFELSHRLGETNDDSLYLKVDSLNGNHQLLRLADSSTAWTLGVESQKLALSKEGNFALRDVEANELQQQVVAYAQGYLGSGYGGTGLCTADSAHAGTCTTQCGSFVTNVFRYGLGLSETRLPWGNGNEKCNRTNNLLPSFLDADLLQPGDIFSSDGTSDAAQLYGHTGIFVGFGRVETPARPNGNSYCYAEFIPEPNGEPVFIHSVGPVCYNTLNQLTAPQAQGGQARNMYGFCRHEVLDIPQTPTLTTEQEEDIVPYQWLEYDQELHDTQLCRDNKKYFRFQATIDTLEDPLSFSIYLDDVVAPHNDDEESDLRRCGVQDVAVLSWSIPSDSEPIYSFDVLIETDTTSYIPFQLLEIEAQETTQTDPTQLTTMNQLFKRETPTKIYYYYLLNRIQADLLEEDETYYFTISPYDHYQNIESFEEATRLEVTIPVRTEEELLSGATGGAGILIDAAIGIGECTDASEYDYGLFNSVLGELTQGVDFGQEGLGEFP